jgi:hypothetical protein
MSRSIERTHVPASTEYRYDRADGPRDRSLRVGDKERDAVGEILRRHHLEGRLDTDELQSRLERCMVAKTYAELDGLIADLPGEEERPRPVAHLWTLRPWPFPFLFLPLGVIAAIALGAHGAWLLIPLFFFVVRPLTWRAWGGGYRRGVWACGPRRTTRA